VGIRAGNIPEGGGRREMARAGGRGAKAPAQPRRIRSRSPSQWSLPRNARISSCRFSPIKVRSACSTTARLVLMPVRRMASATSGKHTGGGL